MIPREKPQDIIRDGEFIEQEMDIAKGQKAWIFDILRNKTYKDKIGSPIREYLANAIDEHIKLGKQDIPVEIWFPTVFSNELRIRDFGQGLSDTDVVRFFANYGESDKRESNDLIGAFGIGCKSAFAYTDSFTIVSYFNGTQTTFNMYIDESRVGKIARLTASETDQPNGIEIIIPVKPQDVSTFVERGLSLIKYFKTKPAIKGIARQPEPERESAVAGKTWKYFGDSRGTVVIQGQIGYPVDLKLMGQRTYSNNAPAPKGYILDWEYQLLSSGLEIEVPIGAVEVTASREELEMNDYTIAAIRKRLEEIREEIVDLVSEKFKTAKTLVEAKTAYYNFFQKGGSYGSTLATSVGKIRWNGQEITNSTIHLTDGHRVMQYKKKYNGDIVLTAFDKIQCHDDLNLYHDDTDRKQIMYKRRAKTLLDAGATQVTIIQTDDAKKFKAETGLDVKKLPSFSKIVPTVLASTRLGTGTGIDITKRIKHKVKVFQLDWKKLSEVSRVRGAKSDYWTVAEIEIDKQVYVPIERFEPKGLFDNDLQKMKAQLADLSLLGIDIAKTPIYGIKTGLDTGEMVRLDAWALEQAKSVPTLAAEVAVLRDYLTGELFDFNVNLSGLKDGTLAKDYATQYAAAKKLANGSYRYQQSASVKARLNLAELIKLDIPDLGKLKKLSNDFKLRYPLLRHVSTYTIEQNQAHVFDYINLVDEARDAEASAVAMAAVA